MFFYILWLDDAGRGEFSESVSVLTLHLFQQTQKISTDKKGHRCTPKTKIFPSSAAQNSTHLIAPQNHKSQPCHLVGGGWCSTNTEPHWRGVISVGKQVERIPTAEENFSPCKQEEVQLRVPTARSLNSLVHPSDELNLIFSHLVIPT